MVCAVSINAEHDRSKKVYNDNYYLKGEDCLSCIGEHSCKKIVLFKVGDHILCPQHDSECHSCKMYDCVCVQHCCQLVIL